MNLKTCSSIKNWWLQSKEEITHNFNTDSHQGLSESEAQKRLQEFGYNQLIEQPKVSTLHLFLSQLSSVIVWVLLAAAIIA